MIVVIILEPVLSRPTRDAHAEILGGNRSDAQHIVECASAGRVVARRKRDWKVNRLFRSQAACALAGALPKPDPWGDLRLRRLRGISEHGGSRHGCRSEQQ